MSYFDDNEDRIIARGYSVGRRFTQKRPAPNVADDFDVIEESQIKKEEPMTYLFFDTETTGFPSPNLPARDPKQGRVCQIAALLTDEKGRSISEFSTLIQPDGWAIGSGAFGVHGISDDHCQRYGIPSGVAFDMFARMAERAEMLVAHNFDFDVKMLRIESEAHGIFLNDYRDFCTMKETTDLCRIPKARGSGYKWPSLDEALQFLCGRGVGKDAHDAMIDTRACRDIFFALQDRQLGEGLV